LRASRKSLFKGFDICGPPATHFLKVLTLAGFPQIIPQRVWCFRAWRKSFPEWFEAFVVCGKICVNVLHVAVCLWL